MKALLLILTFGLGLNHLIQDPARIGTLKFTPPKGWQAASSPGAAAYSLPDLPAGKTCQVSVLPDEFDKDGFLPWYNRKWNSAVSAGRFMLRMSERASQKFGKVEAFLKSGAYKLGAGEGYILFIGLSMNGRFIAVSYESNDYPLFEKHQDEVYKMVETFSLVDGPPVVPTNPTVGSPTVTRPPTSTSTTPGKPMGTLPPMRSRSRLKIPTALPEGVPMPAGNPDQAASILAKQVTAYNATSLPALVTALRASGFTIRTPDRKLISKPLTAKGNGMFVDDQEVLTYFAMSCRGDSVEASGVTDAVDFLLAKTGAPIRLTTLLPQTIANGLASSEPGTRFFARFLVEIGKSLPQAYDISVSQSGRPARITPLETFLILRTFTEDMRRAANKALKKFAFEQQPLFRGPFVPFFDQGQASQYGLTGSQEDAFAFIQTWSVSQIIEGLERETLGTVMNSINVLSSFAKFVSTYYCLEAKFTVSAPGEPLIRTHSMSTNGDRRTLNAEIQMNSTKLHEFLKMWRLHFGFTGIDVDMPAPGNLVKANVRWRLPGYTGMNTLDKPVQFVGSNIEETETDTGGVAHVDIEGTKQRQLIPEGGPPAKFEIPIQVMVQVKGVEMTQDMLDAFTAGVGFGGENPFWAVPGVIQEMVFRSKIVVNGTMNLKFVDWVPGSLKAAFSVEVNGSGTSGKGTDKTVWSVHRTYMAEGWLVPIPGAFMPQVARELDKVPGARIVFGFTKNADRWVVNDSEVRNFTGMGCDDKMHKGHTGETYVGPLANVNGHFANRGLTVVYDYATKRLFTDIREPTVDGHHRYFASSDGKTTKNVDEDIAFGLFPQNMSEAVDGRPLGYFVEPKVDISELSAGDVLSQTFTYKQAYRFHDAFLNLKYQYLIKPSFDEDEGGLTEPEKEWFGLKLSEYPPVSSYDSGDDMESAATCFATKMGPLRSLNHQVARHR